MRDMKTSDIKIMFERADKELPIQSEKKEQTFEKMSFELERQKHPVVWCGVGFLVLLQLF